MIKASARITTCIILFFVMNLSGCHGSEPVPAIGDDATTPDQYASIGLVGSKDDVTTQTMGGTVLMGGGTDVDNAIRWMIERSGGGDFVVIRATGSTGYNNYIMELGEVNSVETLLINSREKAERKAVGDRIREAEAVFIAGGDQWNYVSYWKDSEVSDALRYLIEEKKVPIGGTSAGCAILSELIFDAENGSVISEEALANPYRDLVSLSKSFISLPYLENTVADQHYSQRDRLGRHVAFMARLSIDFSITNPKGIGVDERTAVCIDDEGNATVFGGGHAYFLIGNGPAPEIIEAGSPLTWNANESAVRAYIFQGAVSGREVFNLEIWPTTSPQEFWFVENGTFTRRQP